MGTSSELQAKGRGLLSSLRSVCQVLVRPGKGSKGETMSQPWSCVAAVILSLAVSFAGLFPAVAHADGLAAEASRQLELAESDFASEQYQRAADSAASAFRLDGTLHSALVVQGLALRYLGRIDEAKALLVAYTTIRGDLELDPRVEPALQIMALDEQIEQGDFDHASAVQAARDALSELKTAEARVYIEAVRGRDNVDPLLLQEALGLEGLAYWYEGFDVQAREVWNRLFRDYPGAVVDPKLPPRALAAMAEEQGFARRGKGNSRLRGRAAPQPADLVVLLATGGAMTAAGLGVSAGSYEKGMELYPGLVESSALYDSQIDEYRRTHVAERVGVAIASTGAALLTAGVVRLIVDQVVAKNAARSRQARLRRGPVDRSVTVVRVPSRED